MAKITALQLKESINEILRDADLDNLSAKKVRKTLEEKFDTDFTTRKQEIDQLVMKQIAESQNDEDSETDKPVNGINDEAVSSSDDDLIDAEPVKKKKKLSKAKNDDDEELAKKLQEEESVGMGTRGFRKRKKPMKSDKPKIKKERKGTSTYSKKCQLSEVLAAIVGTDQLPRSEVVKKMWEIARARNLQDPKNKQFMLCDDELRKVFGRKRVRMFGMMKDLKSHIFDVNDML